MKKFLTAILAAAMVTVSIAACGGGGEPSTTVSSTATSTASSTAVPSEGSTPTTTTAKDPSEMKIFFVSKLVGTQYWSVVEQGVKDACADLGITNLTINGPASDSEIEKQIQILQDAVSSQADAILIAPTDSSAMVNDVNTAYESGIPIICIDTIINSDNYSAALLTNNVEAGRISGETILTRLKESGLSEDETISIAIQVSSMGSQTVKDRVDGFNEYWSANAPANWKVLNDDIKVNDGNIEKAISFGQDFITTYPDLKVLFAPNNGSTVGFATALKESGRTDIMMLGFDYSSEIADLIENTDLDVSTVLQQQYLMGYQGVETAVGLVNGVAPAEKDIDTGVMVVNKSNIQDPEIQEIVNMGK